MIDDIVSRAKYLQDKEYEEMSSIQPDISKFQLDLVEGLKSFVDLAKKNQVSGVDYKELKNPGEGTREFYFQVREENYVLVMVDEIYPMDITGKIIGNLAYLYFDGHLSNTPIIEISIYKDSTNGKFCSVSWFTTNDKNTITGNFNLDENSGVKVAEDILRFIYRQSRCWKSAPSRADFKSNKSKKVNLGFLAEQS